MRFVALVRARKVKVELGSAAVHVNEVADTRRVIRDLTAAKDAGIGEPIPNGGVDELRMRGVEFEFPRGCAGLLHAKRHEYRRPRGVDTGKIQTDAGPKLLDLFGKRRIVLGHQMKPVVQILGDSRELHCEWSCHR